MECPFPVGWVFVGGHLVEDTSRYPLAGICDQWRELIQKAAKQGWEQFHQYAHETYQFFDGPPNFMWNDEYAYNQATGFLNRDGGIRLPTFKVSINKISDAVDLYGPSLMHRYPQVMVTPNYPTEVSPESLGIDLSDPQGAMQYLQVAQSRAATMKVRDTTAQIAQDCLNWFQIAGHKKDHARNAITDAIVSGLGCGYTKIYRPRGSGIRFPVTEFVASHRIIKDPDATTHSEVLWIAIECIEPVNLVEDEYNLPPGTLKGKFQSSQSSSTKRGLQDAKNNRKQSESWDLIRYWKIFSKNGAGTKLKTANKVPEEVRQLVESFGDFCYLAVAEDVPYPLNLPTELLMNGELDDIQMAMSWPTPFHRDSGSGKDWPITELYFKENPRSKWPPSIFKHLLGEIRFVNWVFSFMADKVALSATDYLGVMKSAAENIQEQLRSQRGPFQFIEIDSAMGRKLDELIHFLDRPQFDTKLWDIVQKVIDEIERGSGVTDLLYGMQPRQMRSAEEARVLGENSTIRPDEMAEKCDEWYSMAAGKEWQAAIWHLNQDDIAPVVGEAAAYVFASQIVVQPFETFARDYNYAVLADSARKPDRATRKAALQEFGQVAMPMMMQLAQSGVMNPYNAWVEEFAKSIRLSDWEKFTVPNEDIQQAMQTVAQQQAEAQAAAQGGGERQPPSGPSPEEQAAEREMANQQELQHRQAIHEQKLAQDAQMALLKLQAQGAKESVAIEVNKQHAAQQLAQSESGARLKIAQAAMMMQAKHQAPANQTQRSR